MRKEGFIIGRYRTRMLMKRLKLRVVQRQAHKVTTLRKHHHEVAKNWVNQDFNSQKPNQVWEDNVTYLRTHQGWMYLSIVMDLYSRRIIGWAMDKRMTTALVERVMQRAIILRKPSNGLIFYSVRGSQYTK